MYNNTENAQIVYDLLVNTYNYTDYGARAIMTNMSFESGFDPKAYNPASGAGGLCQWVGDRQTALIQYCSANGLGPTTIEGQVAFLDHELRGTYNGNGGVFLYDDLQSCTQEDLERCTLNFCASFEAPSPSGNWQESEQIGRYRLNNVDSSIFPTSSPSPRTGNNQSFIDYRSKNWYDGPYRDNGQVDPAIMEQLKSQYGEEGILSMTQEEFSAAVTRTGNELKINDYLKESYKQENGYTPTTQSDANAVLDRLNANYSEAEKARFFDNQGNLTPEGQQAADMSYKYGDFANQAYAMGLVNPDPYKNPFTKESMDLLDPSVRNQLLTAVGPMGDMMRSIYYGNQNPSSTQTSVINMNPTLINGTISKINSCIDEVNSILNSINTNEIAKINSSWIANEASSYVGKVSNATRNINVVNDGLSLLSKTFQNSINKYNEAANNIRSGINSTLPDYSLSASNYNKKANDIINSATTEYNKKANDVINSATAEYNKKANDVIKSATAEYNKKANDVIKSATTEYNKKANDVIKSATTEYNKKANDVIKSSTAEYNKKANDVIKSATTEYNKRANDVIKSATTEYNKRANDVIKSATTTYNNTANNIMKSATTSYNNAANNAMKSATAAYNNAVSKMQSNIKSYNF